MGHHYVPQQYLRAFESQPGSGLVWMFDRQSKVTKEVPIKGSAQAPDYYEPEIERQLSAIEGPAHAALARVITTGTIENDDREILAYYVAVMMYRGPRRRRQSEEMVPGVLETTIAKLQKRIDEWASTKPEDDSMVKRRRAEVDAIAEKYRVEPPQSVTDQVRSPWPSGRVFQIVARKTWRLIVVGAIREQFVTSDSPAFFFEGFGLGDPKSELTFPLSPRLALIADWQGEPYSVQIVSAKPGLIREVNRRVVSGAERFVFSSVPQPWLPVVAGKANPFLSRIDWTGR